MGIMVVYSVTCRKSFEQISNWMKNINHLAPNGSEIIIIANKADMVQQREVSVSDGIAVAEQFAVSGF